MNQPLPPMQPVQRTSTAAIISLVAGIAGVVQILPLIGPVAAIIAGHMAKKEIKASAGTVGGNGMATAGLILGYITVALIVIALCLVLLSVLGVFTIAGISIFPFLATPNY
jgi:hypothetical protein